MRAVTGRSDFSASRIAWTIAAFDTAQVIGIDAADERARAPEAHRVRPVVVVRARNQDVIEAGQFLADAFDRRQEQADDVGTGDGDRLVAVAQDDGADGERIEDGGRLAVGPEAGEIDRLAAELRRDVGLAEADLQLRRSDRKRD